MLADGPILILASNQSLVQVLQDGISQLSTQRIILVVSSASEASNRAHSHEIGGLIVADSLELAEFEFIHDFCTAFQSVPILLVSDSPESCAELVSGSPLIQFLRIPIHEREMQAALIPLLYPNGVSARNRLEAYFSGLFPADILQLMHSTGMSAHLVFAGLDGDLGDVEVRNGHVVAAGIAGLDGTRAILQMLGMRSGQVIQYPPRPNVEQNVFIPTNHLLIRAATSMDEAFTKTASETQVRQQALTIESLEHEYSDAPKLLVVEDNEFLLSYLELLLGEAFPGVVIIGVPKGVDGLACVKSGPPHAIILDRHLTDMKGEYFSRTLRTIPGAEHIPILLISGDIPTSEVCAKEFAGPVWFLEKPFLAPALVAKLREMLGVPVSLAA